MSRFLADMLTSEEVYDLLVEDFASDGHPGARAQHLVLDDPAAGLGYRTVSAAQGFLNRYVNSDAGRVRYRIGDRRIAFTRVPPPRTVGHLAYTIHQAQVPKP